MNRQHDIESIVSQVKPWPEEDRVALAYLLLRDMRKKTRNAAPRHTVDRAVGLARGSSPPPDDATVKRWIAERRQEKYG